MLFNLVLTVPFLLCARAVDKTLMPETQGEDVVCDVINKIEKSLIFSGDENMLRRIAYTESEFGAHQNTYRNIYRNGFKVGYHGGIWQVDEIAFFDAITNGSNPNLERLWPKIEKLLSKNKEDIKW